MNKIHFRKTVLTSLCGKHENEAVINVDKKRTTCKTCLKILENENRNRQGRN